jgi:hypothetical protein
MLTGWLEVWGGYANWRSPADNVKRALLTAKSCTLVLLGLEDVEENIHKPRMGFDLRRHKAGQHNGAPERRRKHESGTARPSGTRPPDRKLREHPAISTRQVYRRGSVRAGGLAGGGMGGNGVGTREKAACALRACGAVLLCVGGRWAGAHTCLSCNSARLLVSASGSKLARSRPRIAVLSMSAN